MIIYVGGGGVLCVLNLDARWSYQVHTLAVLLPGRSPQSHWIAGWVSKCWSGYYPLSHTPVPGIESQFLDHPAHSPVVIQLGYPGCWCNVVILCNYILVIFVTFNHSSWRITLLMSPVPLKILQYNVVVKLLHHSEPNIRKHTTVKKKLNF